MLNESRLLRSFAHRNFRLFFAGQLISLVGTWTQSVAQAWLIYRLTGSSFMLGLAGFASQFPVFVLSLYGGLLADRHNRRALLLCTQAAALAQSALLAWLTLSGKIEIWQILVLASLLGVVNAIDIPVRQSFLLELVGREELHNAIGLNSSMFHLARVAGPGLAGVLLSLAGEGWCFAVNAASFAAVLLCLWLIRIDEAQVAPQRRAGLGGIRDGLAYVRGTPKVRDALLLVGLLSLFGSSYLVLMPVFASKVLGGGPRELGILLGLAGCGSLCSALILASRREGRGLGPWRYWPGLGLGVALVLFSRADTLGLAGLCALLAGFCMLLFSSASNTWLQLSVPEALRGRVISMFSMMFVGMYPFGALFAGALAKSLGAPLTVAFCGAACLGFAFWFGRGAIARD